MTDETVDIARLACEDCKRPGAQAASPKQHSAGYWTCGVCFHVTYGPGYRI